jgi:type I restriction enzyme R subunit
VSTTNFAFLEGHDSLLLQRAITAESAFVPDPNTTLLKLRQLGEALAQDIASRLGIEVEERSTQLDLLRKVQNEVNIPREVTEAFHDIRRTGNEATHEFTSNTEISPFHTLHRSPAKIQSVVFVGEMSESGKYGGYFRPISKIYNGFLEYSWGDVEDFQLTAES